MASIANIEETQPNEKMTTRRTVKSKRKKASARETNETSNGIQGEVKSQEPTENENQILRSDLENRDHTIAKLTQERDQLQKENETLKNKLEELGIKSPQSPTVRTSDTKVDIVAGRRRHRALPQTPTSILKP